MEAFLVSISTVGLAEMGDRTQLLSLMLAARFRRPWPILAGVLVATMVNHALAAALGSWIGRFLTPAILDGAVGASMIAMALWLLKPDSLDDGKDAARRKNPFIATTVAFFIAEIGDKTQIATLALGAAYPSLAAVVAGTTCGMLAANAPAVFLGKAFADRLPVKVLHYGASALFIVIAVVFAARAIWG